MNVRIRTTCALILAVVTMASLVFTTNSANAATITPTSYVYGANAESLPQSGPPTNNPNLGDAGNTRLTDGVIATAWNTDPNVGFRNDAENGNPQPRVTFDLGGLHSLTTVDVWSLAAFGNANESVSISSSTDNVLFSAPVVVNPIVWTPSGGGDTTVVFQLMI